MEETCRLFCAKCNDVTTWTVVYPGGLKRVRCNDCGTKKGAMTTLELPPKGPRLENKVD